MSYIHYTAVCHGYDNVILPSEFTAHPGKKIIKIIGVSAIYHSVNGLVIPYMLCSQKLNRYLKQPYISTNLSNPIGNEVDYLTLTTTINNGYYVTIPWDYEKIFDIELVDCYQGLTYNYDYVIEMELDML